jgi:hypothetical protein
MRPRTRRPSLGPDEKRAAREHAEACKDAAADFKVAVAVLAVPAAAVGPVLGYGLLAAILVALFDRETRKAERAANDPPRLDYEVETRAQPSRIDPRVLGETWLAPVAVPAAENLRNSTALLSATVRGLERAQGAIDSGVRTTAQLRLDEARSFATNLGALASPTDFSLSMLATELAASEGRQSFPNVGAIPVLPGPIELPPLLDGRVRAAGVNPRELFISKGDLARGSREPTQSLRRAGKTLRRLGEELGTASFAG